MKQMLKRIVLTTTLGLSLLFSGGAMLAPAVTHADASTDAAKQQACEGAGGTWANGSCNGQGPDLTGTVRKVVSIISVMVGVAAVIMIMVGGFKYITSGGDSGKISNAKSTITYAIIGLVIVAFAQFIVQFVVHNTK